MKAVTAEEMRALDRRATEEFGIPSLLLMENAGRGIADLICSLSFPKIIIFSGKGNNGGDGFVAARHLHNRGLQVKVLLLADPAQLKGDAALNFEIISKMKIPVVILMPEVDPKGLLRGESHKILRSAQEAMLRDAMTADLIVDALFGTGLRAPLEGLEALAVQAMNQPGCRVLAVDIPSGIDSDTGEVRGIAVKAEMTAALGLAKQGLLRGEGPRHAGEIRLLDIGLPA